MAVAALALEAALPREVRGNNLALASNLVEARLQLQLALCQNCQ
jgi:hypothetical protein